MRIHLAHPHMRTHCVVFPFYSPRAECGHGMPSGQQMQVGHLSYIHLELGYGLFQVLDPLVTCCPSTSDEKGKSPRWSPSCLQLCSALMSWLRLTSLSLPGPKYRLLDVASRLLGCFLIPYSQHLSAPLGKHLAGRCSLICRMLCILLSLFCG